MSDNLLEILVSAGKITKTANRHSQSLSGNGFYGKKFSEHHAEATLALQKLNVRFKDTESEAIKDSLLEIQRNFDDFFNTKNSNKDRGLAVKNISFIFHTILNPALETAPLHPPTDDLFPLDLVRGTRGYIERIAEQACGSYDQGWYDASAVMIRRLLEILIIESFESHTLSSKIQLPDGTFFYLQDLIAATLNETCWTIGRNVRKALPNLKDIGNQSAHGRRYVARKNDLFNIKRDLRLTIEELVILSGLKK